MSSTPKATPVVIAQPQTEPTSERITKRGLCAPVVVVSTMGEYELERGELIIGRDPSAHVVIEDPLVSRFHARIRVREDGRVVVEDLQSANGVFVNSAKLLRPLMVLDEGDRILVGTTELSVFSTRVANTATSTYPVASVPVNSVVQLKRTNLAEPANCEATRSTEKYPFAVTKRSAGPQSIGLFAEQIMSVGHPLEAIRVLSEHLESVLAGATAGLIVPAEILLSATQNAFRMYRWTKRASWLEYVLELHLASQQVPSEEVLPEFEAGVVASADFDSALIRYFCATLERRVNPLTVDEMKRLRLIERFGKSEKSDSYSPPSR